MGNLAENPDFLGFFVKQKKTKKKDKDKERRKNILWESGKGVQINEIRYTRNEVPAIRRTIYNWIRLYLH